jgi:tetratricopeptide (TPR) repeat protein
MLTIKRNQGRWRTMCQGFLLILLWPLNSAATTSGFDITVAKPTFVLPQFTGAFSEREASIAPEEYETAERLRAMLDSNRRDAVLQELEKSYDIELSAAMLTLKAQIYFSLEMYDKAEATYLAVLQRKPQLVRAHSDLAQLYLVREDFPKARQYFANAVSFGSNEALIHGQLAYLNLTMYGPYSAISGYQQAMALEPENFQWQQGLLAALSQARMYEAAQALLQDLLRKRPSESNLWLNNAALALHQEEYKQAAVSLEMAMLLGDKDPKNLKTAAQLHLQLNSYDRALALLDQSLKSGVLEMNAIREYFMWLTQLEMWERANSLLAGVSPRINQMNGDDQSQFYSLQAKIESHKKNYPAARKLFKQSLERNPSNGEAMIEYAQLASAQQDYVEAELLYIRAEAIPRTQKGASLGRAQLYIDMKDYPAALNQLQNVYQKNPDMFELKNNIEIIENIVRAKKTTEK